MGKNKLKKFAEMENFKCVLQYPFSVIKETTFPYKGKWKSDFFKNSNPIVLELGCGKGEYAVGLSKLFPSKNFIGVDIKGARMWTGAKIVEQEQITNVAFLRTSIELIHLFFAPGEVDEIWITFPDPQMKNCNKRLTGTRFLSNYRNILVDNGIIHLKTDSPFLYAYTAELIKINKLPVEICTDNLYDGKFNDDILSIKTHYEQQWLSRGLSIKYIKFRLPVSGSFSEPTIDIEHDNYRSYHRDKIDISTL